MKNDGEGEIIRQEFTDWDSAKLYCASAITPNRMKPGTLAIFYMREGKRVPEYRQGDVIVVQYVASYGYQGEVPRWVMPLIYAMSAALVILAVGIIAGIGGGIWYIFKTFF